MKKKQLTMRMFKAISRKIVQSECMVIKARIQYSKHSLAWKDETHYNTQLYVYKYEKKILSISKAKVKTAQAKMERSALRV